MKTFRVSDGTISDDCDHTDGVTATTADLGAAFPRACSSVRTTTTTFPALPGTSLKMVRLEKIVNLDGGEEPPPPPPPPPPPTSVSFLGQATRNANSTAFTV